MGDVQTLLDQINKIQTGGEASKAIDDIVECLDTKIQKNAVSLGRWEKHHYWLAISALGWNLNGHGLPESWLRYSLACIEKAEVPVEGRNEEFVPIDAAFDEIKPADLLALLESMKQLNECVR